MKTKNNLNHYLLLLIVGLLSCGEEQVYFPDISTVESQTRKVKFVHASPDAGGVHFYVNDVKVSNGSSIGSTITFTNAFPATNYAALSFEALSIKTVVPATAALPEKVLTTSALSTENQKYYTVAMTGISPNYETVIFNDDIASTPYDGKSYIRIINLIHNSVNKISVNGKLGTGADFVITNNLAYKNGAAFIALEPGDYTIRLIDATNNIVMATITDPAVGGLAANRVYTFFARGQIGQTGTKAPTLSRMTNR